MGVRRDRGAMGAHRRATRRAVAVASIGVLAAGAGLLGAGSVSASDGVVAVAVASSSDDSGPAGEWRGPEHLVGHLRAALAPLVESGVLTEEQVDAVVDGVLAAVEAHRAERLGERAEWMGERLGAPGGRMGSGRP